MPRLLTRIASLDDPRVAHYRNLKDRDLAAEGGRFIAEGEQVVKRLLASRFETESVLLAERRVDEIALLVPDQVPVYVGSSEVVNSVIGFKFHSGVMAVGRRGTPLSIEQIARPIGKPLTLVICPELANTENLGSLVRVSAGFGADALILGPRSCNPFFRQSVRVSMGTVFSLPIIESDELLRDMARLRGEFGVELIATVLDETAEPLSDARRPDRVGLLFGNEAQGLTPAEIAGCGRRVTIPMKLGTDSLNVTIAAAVILYHFSRD